MAKSSQGPDVAKSGHMADITDEDVMVSLLREYARPEFRTKPNKQDLKRANTVELQYLQGQLARHKDQIRRLKEEIEDEIKMLTAVLEEDRKESIGNIKRRISRLKGALEYRGREDYIEHREWTKATGRK